MFWVWHSSDKYVLLVFHTRALSGVLENNSGGGRVSMHGLQQQKAFAFVKSLEI